MEYATRKNGLYESVEFKANAIQTEGMGNITLKAKIDDGVYCNHTVISRCNKITPINLPITVDFKLVSKFPFSYVVPFLLPRYMDKKKIEDYLYEITYGRTDYEYAKKYFSPYAGGGCSAVRKGSLFGRNFDWLYDNSVQFIVHTPTSLDRYATIGISGIIPNIVQSNVENNDIIVDGVDMFKLVPFHLLDGINEKGVFCTHNVVPLDDETSPTTEIRARLEERERICIPMLVRYILDHFCSAESAIEYIRNFVTLYFSDTMIDANLQSHIFLGDGNSTYILEFIDGEMHVLKGNYITNFCIKDVTFDTEGKVQYPPTLYGVNKFGFGLERWDIIVEDYDSAKTADGMRALLDKVKYSNCYSDVPSLFWQSELIRREDDEGNVITVDTDASDCTDARAAVLTAYHNRSRNDPKVWITCHSAIYDLARKELYVRNQEGETEYTFGLL